MCDSLIFALFSRFAPSVLVVQIAVGAVTLLMGLAFAAAFLFGVICLAVGLQLDSYGTTQVGDSGRDVRSR